MLGVSATTALVLGVVHFAVDGHFPIPADQISAAERPESDESTQWHSRTSANRIRNLRATLDQRETARVGQTWCIPARRVRSVITWHFLPADPSRLAALLVGQIRSVFSLVVPYQPCGSTTRNAKLFLTGHLVSAKRTASGRVTRGASSDPAGYGGKRSRFPFWGRLFRTRKENLSMHDWQSLGYPRWECTDHVVIIPKFRRKVLSGELRKAGRTDSARAL